MENGVTASPKPGRLLGLPALTSRWRSGWVVGLGAAVLAAVAGGCGSTPALTHVQAGSPTTGARLQNDAAAFSTPTVLSDDQVAALLRTHPPIVVPPRVSHCAPDTPVELRATACEPPRPDLSKWPVEPRAGQTGLDPESAQVAAGAFSGPETTLSAPTVEARTTYAYANRLLAGDPPNPEVDTSAPVWIVTVHKAFPIVFTINPRPDGRNPPPPPPPPVYTIILDAANGHPIESCSGCSSLDGVATTSP